MAELVVVEFCDFTSERVDNSVFLIIVIRFAVKKNHLVILYQGINLGICQTVGLC